VEPYHFRRRGQVPRKSKLQREVRGETQGGRERRLTCGGDRIQCLFRPNELTNRLEYEQRKKKIENHVERREESAL
jgi:hypothetical protein